MKTKLEQKQKDYIAYLLKWIILPQEGGEKSLRMQRFESEIAELEKQGTELPPVEKQQQKELIIESFEREQSGKSAEDLLKDAFNPNHDIWASTTSQTIIMLMQEYREQGMPTEGEIESEAHRIAMYKGFTYSAAKRKDACIRMAKWVLNKWKGNQ